MNSIRPLIVGLAGAATMAFASCSTTNSDNPDYVTYPSDGDYGTYGSNSGGGAYATNDTGVGAGGAYPTSPQNNYGNDYGTDYGSTGTTNTNTGGGAASSSQTHTVQRGETLYRISRNYGTTVANIKAANGLTTDLIHPGDVLVVR